MPIYEYACEICGRITSQSVLHPAQDAPPECRVCARPTRRVILRFAVLRTEANRLVDLDPNVSQGADFYRDARHVGLTDKKRAHRQDDR